MLGSHHGACVVKPRAFKVGDRVRFSRTQIERLPLLLRVIARAVNGLRVGTVVYVEPQSEALGGAALGVEWKPGTTNHLPARMFELAEPRPPTLREKLQRLGGPK